MMKSYSHRKRSKINLKSKLSKQVEESPSWVKSLLGHFEVPSMDVVSKRFALFGFIAGWSIATSAETGPTFQVYMLVMILPIDSEIPFSLALNLLEVTYSLRLLLISLAVGDWNH